MMFRADVVAIRSRTVNPHYVDLSCLEYPFRLETTSTSFGIKFDSKLTFEVHVGGIVSRVAQRICMLRLVKMFSWTPLLLRCYYEFVLKMLEYCSPVWRSAADCHLQLLDLNKKQINFDLRNKVSERINRNGSDIHIDYRRTALGQKKTVSVSGAKLWNSIPMF